MHDNESTAVGLQYYIRVPQQTGGTRHSYLLLPIIVSHNMDTHYSVTHTISVSVKGGGALCAGNAVALLVFGPVMP